MYSPRLVTVTNDLDAKDRLLKAEYIFAPYRPGKAILTGGNLDFGRICGSLRRQRICGCPLELLRDGCKRQHDVAGTLSASGSVSSCGGAVTGGCKSSQPPERVPEANPRAVYQDYAITTSQWYDLCPDGTAKSPSASGPCQGSTIASSPYNDWTYTPGNATTPGTWIADYSGTQYPGVYYVYGANAQLGNNGNSNTTVTMTVLAESTTPSGYTNAATCNKPAETSTGSSSTCRTTFAERCSSRRAACPGAPTRPCSHGHDAGRRRGRPDTSSASGQGRAHGEQHLCWRRDQLDARYDHHLRPVGGSPGLQRGEHDAVVGVHGLTARRRDCHDLGLLGTTTWRSTLLRSLASVGLLVGSFLNVVIARVPAGESVVRPRSRCPKCGTEIVERDNIPVLSWLLLGRKCRSCREPISVRYPLVEIGNALLWLGVLWVFGWSPELRRIGTSCLCGLALALIDLDTKRLPDVLTLPSYPVMGVLLLVPAIVDGDWGAYGRAWLAGIALLAFYFLLAFIYPAGMGLGDVKLSGVLGLAMGWIGWGAWWSVASSVFLSAPWSASRCSLCGAVGGKYRYPYGPWMILGAWIGVVWGQDIWSGYIDTFTGT